MKTLHSSRSSTGSFNQAVSRSNEFLSCAKTSWKIQQRRRAEGNQPLPPAHLKNPIFSLASSEGPPPASLDVLEDCLTLLRGMEYGTKQLQGLVRRRGHTNDPTEEIGAIVKQLEQDFKELSSSCEQMLKIRRRKQEQRHWELIAQWFKQFSNYHSEQLQECLKLRGEILADQAQKRRKLVERKSGNNGPMNARFKETESSKSLFTPSSSAATTPLFDSPLFTATPSNRMSSKPSRIERNSLSNKEETMSSQELPSSASTTTKNPYRAKTGTLNGGTGATKTAGGSAYGTAYNFSVSSTGYGGGSYGGSGMRQRRGGNTLPPSGIPLPEQEEENKIHSQIQIREQKRQTQQRLDEARQAESTLSEVAKLYSKMSTLVTQQGETLEKIEDDVERALGDVSSGQEELTKLYSIKKGNRPLIIKTFLILNFLIILMRGYKDR